ncbi:MAG: hypothetical protein ACERLM_10320 [Acidimicrobiales bacterium]
MTIVVKGGQLIDRDGVRDGLDLVIDDGVIAAVGADLDGEVVVDGEDLAGKTLIADFDELEAGAAQAGEVHHRTVDPDHRAGRAVHAHSSATLSASDSSARSARAGRV